MRKQDLNDKAQNLYNAVVADRRNNGQPVDAKSIQPIALGFEIGVAVLGALFSIEESLATVAKAKRHDMGYKPGDEVETD